MFGELAAAIHIIQERGIFGHFVVWTIQLLLSEFRHGYRVVLFLSWSIKVTVALFDLVFCEIVYIQQKRTKACLEYQASSWLTGLFCSLSTVHPLVSLHLCTIYLSYLFQITLKRSSGLRTLKLMEFRDIPNTTTLLPLPH